MEPDLLQVGAGLRDAGKFLIQNANSLDQVGELLQEVSSLLAADGKVDTLVREAEDACREAAPRLSAIKSDLNAIAAALSVFSIPSIEPITTNLNLGLTNINVLTGLTIEHRTPLGVLAGRVSGMSADVGEIRTRALKVASALNGLQAELQKIAQRLRQSGKDLTEASVASRESGKSLLEAGVTLSRNN